jgi:hypothetical protein
LTGATAGRPPSRTDQELILRRLGVADSISRRTPVPKLGEALELAGRNLLGVLDPAAGCLPTWRVDPYVEGGPASDVRYPSHNIGRWWIAMLELEATIGFNIPRDIERIMLDHLSSLLANPRGLPCHLPGYVDSSDSPTEDDGTPVDSHSLRETLLALVDLIRYRQSDWATDRAARMVASLENMFATSLALDDSAERDMAEWSGQARSPRDQLHRPGPETVYTHGRLIEPLVAYHQVTGDERGLRLAGALVDFHLNLTTRPDGRLPSVDRLYVHTHSYLNTLRGLLAFGELTGDRVCIDRARVCLGRLMERVLKQSGFITHDLGSEDPRLGETASPGDVAQLAIRLARRGHPELWDVAQRIVRARILPSQIVGDSAPGGDAKVSHRLRARVIGAFGGMNRHPYGASVPTTDVTAADIHSLCEVYSTVAEERVDGWRINLHFDAQRPGLEIACFDDERRQLDIRAERPCRLDVRIPDWTPREEVQTTSQGRPKPAARVGNYLSLEAPGSWDVVSVSYPLPRFELAETIGGVAFTVCWRGDSVEGVRPNAPFLPFYRDLPAPVQ